MQNLCHRFAGAIVVALGLSLLPVLVQARTGSDVPKVRAFRFSYAATVTDLQPGAQARVWLPVPPSNEDQEVKIDKEDLPAAGKLGKEAKYGNDILFLEANADADGKVPLALTFQVLRKEVNADLKG